MLLVASSKLPLQQRALNLSGHARPLQLPAQNPNPCISASLLTLYISIMSDTDHLPSHVSDRQIELALRSAVAALFADDDLENLTVKRVRRAVEKQLQLSPDFLKSHTTWAEKSKDIITTETDLQEASANAPSSSQNQPRSKSAVQKRAAYKSRSTSKISTSAPGDAAKRKKGEKYSPVVPCSS